MVRKCFCVVLFFLFLGVCTLKAQNIPAQPTQLSIAQDKLGSILHKNLDPLTSLGKPLQVGEYTLIPIVSKAFGFGLGNRMLSEAEEGNQGRKNFGKMDRNSEQEKIGYGGGGCVRTEAILVIDKEGNFEILRVSEGTLAQVAKIIAPLVQDLIQKRFEKRHGVEKMRGQEEEKKSEPSKPE